MNGRVKTTVLCFQKSTGQFYTNFFDFDPCKGTKGDKRRPHHFRKVDESGLMIPS